MRLTLLFCFFRISLINLLYVRHLLPRLIGWRLRWLWLTLAVVFLDRASKAWIDSRPEEYFPHAVYSRLSRNSPVAIRASPSVFADDSPAMRYLRFRGDLIGVILALLVASRHLQPALRGWRCCWRAPRTSVTAPLRETMISSKCGCASCRGTSSIHICRQRGDNRCYLLVIDVLFSRQDPVDSH